MNSTFNPETNRRYFKLRLPTFKWNGRAQNNTHCPFHDDANGSFSFNYDSGCWQCHAGCGSGGILDFEKKFSACDHETAKANVAALLGVSFGPEPQATYTYRDALGKVAFRKLRYSTPDGGKTFRCQRPTTAGGWENDLEGISIKPLYRLPELIRSTYAVVAEGEKDADRLVAADLSQFEPNRLPVAVTTNFDGAGKWRSEYNVYFAGRTVTILPDNDPQGEGHGLDVAKGIYPFAAGVKIVKLPDLPEHGDVSDYLDSHSAEDLIREIADTPPWRPDQAAPSSRFKSVAEIRATGSAKAEWILPHFVERSAVTSLSAKIKTGKSSLIFSGCNAVLTGGLFLGQQTIPGPVVMVSEMQGAALNAALDRAGMQNPEGLRILTPSDAAGLTWPQIVTAAVGECRRLSAVLLVVDTLNFFGGLMSDPDENSASKMLQVMRPLQEAANQGWAIWFAVHERKSGGSVQDASRGSSAVGGVADILMSLRRPEGNHPPTMRKIEVISRFPQTQDLVIDWGPDSSYLVVGTSDAAVHDRATVAVMAALPFFSESAVTMKVLCEKTGEKRSTVQRVLKEVRAILIGTGERGDPIRYHRRQIGGSEQ